MFNNVIKTFFLVLKMRICKFIYKSILVQKNLLIIHE